MPNNSDNIDVAISFLSDDEELAKELHDVLSSRLDIFYYAERQDELVSEDGEEAFGKVFRDRARIVVIFYREGWGNTMMTRAEKSAIKQRAAKESYHFTIWVPLGEKKSVPSYIDPQFIWYDIDRWGINGLASVIEKKVQESGKEVHPKTTIDKLKEINDEIKLNEKRSAFERSEKGVEFVRKTDARLEETIKEKLTQFELIDSKINFNIKRERDRILISSFGYRLAFEVDPYASNVITKATLSVLLQMPPMRFSENPSWKDISEYVFKPTLDSDETPKWFLEDKPYSLKELVSFALDEMAERSYEAYAKYTKTGKI